MKFGADPSWIPNQYILKFWRENERMTIDLLTFLVKKKAHALHYWRNTVIGAYYAYMHFW